MRHGHGRANILGFYNLVDWIVKMNETMKLTETGRCLRPQEYRGVLVNDMPHHPNSIFFFLERDREKQPQALPAASAALEFLLLVIDEAHEIFRPGVNREFLEKIPTHQRVLLSSRSQASSGGWLGDAEHF